MQVNGYSRGLAAHYYKTKDRLLQATAEYIGEQYVRLLHEKSDEPVLPRLSCARI